MQEIKYGFIERLSADFPSQIIIDATEICNLACIHCPHEDFKKSEHYGARHLSVELHNKLIDEVAEYGRGKTQYIRYTSNGEPLIHPKIYNMLDYAVKNSGVSITLTTNGTILNEVRIEKLLESGLHLIDISIDAFTPETYAKIRRNGDLRITQENVVKLLKMRNDIGEKTKIIVSFVEQPCNYHESNQFENYWKYQGVDYVVIRRLHSSAGSIKRIAESISDEQGVDNRRPCLYPWERILLNPRGELAYCPQDWFHESVITAYNHADIRDIWQGEYYQKLREAHLRGNFCNFSFCDRCPDWIHTRWPGEGRSYANMVKEIISE